MSEINVELYESTLKQIKAYEALSEKEQITEKEEDHMRLLEAYMENIQLYSEELSDFVKYVEKSGVSYYGDDGIGENNEC